MFTQKYFLWFEDHRANLLVDAVLNKDKREKLYEIVRNEEKIEFLRRLSSVGYAELGLIS